MFTTLTRYLLERQLKQRRRRLDRDAWKDAIDVLTDSYKAGRWETTSTLAHLIGIRRSKRLTWIYRSIKGERIVQLLTPTTRALKLALGHLSYTGSLDIDVEERSLGDMRMFVTRVSLQPHMLERTPMPVDANNPRKAAFYFSH